jgi:hypothetical protein
MPVPPYGHHLNLAMQTMATIVLWGGSAALLAYAVRLGRRERSILPVMLWVSVAVGSIIEPLYDIAYHLLWYTPGQWTLFTAFGLPQPVWVMPAYIMVFGLPAMLLYRRLAAGADLAFIFKVAALLVFTTAVFETTANNVDLYGYYGAAPMRLLKYPLWIAVMEAAQITGFAVLCALLKRRATRPVHSLALLVVFPANFAFDVLGAGFPTVIAQNMPHPDTAVMWLSAVASIGLAATALWWTAQLLLWDQGSRPAAARQLEAPVASERVAAPV